MTKKEVTTLTDVRIYENIDPGLFRLESLQIADGTPVRLSEIADRNKHPIWSNGAVQSDFPVRDQAL